MYQYLITETKNYTLVIMLNRPKQLNALKGELLQELSQVITDMQDDPEIKGAVIIGSGDKAFAAGADISQLANLKNEVEGEAASREGQRVFQLIEDSHKPIIAAVNGYALGGGCELAMACHMRVASEHAKFGQPEVNLGIIAGYGGTQRLVQHVGRAKATELLLTGEMIDADEAYRIGLVNYVVAPGKLADKCLEILRKVYEKSPLAIEYTLKSIAAGIDKEKGYEAERKNFGEVVISEDAKEGTSAFLEKRKPEFKGK